MASLAETPAKEGFQSHAADDTVWDLTSMRHTSLWTCREQGITALADELRPIADRLDSAFERVSEVVEYFEKFLTKDSAAACVCALVTIKGHNLGQGCYSLALDGLGQESGAMLRPLMECIETLEYLRVVPDAVDEALEGKLPNAGVRARRISSIFHRLRAYLNEHAAHLDVTTVAMKHLVDLREGCFKTVQKHSPLVLEQNLASLFMFVSALQQQATLCFVWCARGTYPICCESLLNKSEECHRAGYALVEELHQKRKAAGV
jgi:hypothetical protein